MGAGVAAEQRMGFKCGIVGLPNVGKSTLFNALTRTAAAAAENYPFCTIEPNVGQVPVPDPRLQRLADIAKPKKIVPTLLAFVDIAGLVRGASKGEGLGNQFLGNIREVDAILHVLRCFQDDDVTHVDGCIDPIGDAETVDTELMLSDLESLERRSQAAIKRERGGDKEAAALLGLMRRIITALRDGRPAREVEIVAEEAPAFRQLQLLTGKPVLYVCNVDEASAAAGNEYSRQVEALAARQNAGVVVISASIEAEIAQLDDGEEKDAFLADLGLAEAGLDRVIRAGYSLLGLLTYFTAGPEAVRAWTVTDGTLAPGAAGVIHGDFERGFIRAETITYEDFLSCNGEQGARDAGRMRSEGRDYRVKDGDVMLFRFNV
jgi:GTP-binding protein YchF